ncbi:MAG: divergent polysaccharide deacetylase family protein [Xanthobacteraceae bacterium]
MPDDLNAPLGQQSRRRRGRIRIPVPQIIAGMLAIFLGVFVFWAAVYDDPFGGQPMTVVPIHLTPSKATKTQGSAAPNPGQSASGSQMPGRYDGPSQLPAPLGRGAEASPGKGVNAPGTTTVDIINGTTGARQEVTIPDPHAIEPPAKSDVMQKFIEMTPQGPLPKIAADGVRPEDAFAQPIKPIPGNPDAPRVALIVTGLGISAKLTADAIAKLPGPVTLAFIPYGNDADWVARARARGHEILLQVPMEPFDYPDNDPGPETLLTSLPPEQNMDRLHWLMSRFQGYVGLINMMGARFTASDGVLTPVLRETARRGLIFVDDGSNPRSIAGRIAAANNLPFARAEITLDAVPTPGEIDQALGRLEIAARQHHTAVGIASALPVSIAHIAKWAKSAASRGVLLIPITAAALKDKPS